MMSMTNMTTMTSHKQTVGLSIFVCAIILVLVSLEILPGPQTLQYSSIQRRPVYEGKNFVGM